MYIGSHVSMKGKEMLLGAAQEAASYGRNIFMIYTGAPQNTRRKEVSEFRIEEAKTFMKEHGIEYFTVHATHIVNLANTTTEGSADSAMPFHRDGMARA